MSRSTMVGRGKAGDNVVTNVDVRQGALGALVFDGNERGPIAFTDSDISGATDYAFVVVGELAINTLAFDLTFLFNGGKVGDTISITMPASTEGVATPLGLTGISDAQLGIATSVRLVVTSPIPDAAPFQVYLLKKAVLG